MSVDSLCVRLECRDREVYQSTVEVVIDWSALKSCCTVHNGVALAELLMEDNEVVDDGAVICFFRIDLQSQSLARLPVDHSFSAFPLLDEVDYVFSLKIFVDAFGALTFGMDSMDSACSHNVSQLACQSLPQFPWHGSLHYLHASSQLH